jgi:TolB-like protein
METSETLMNRKIMPNDLIQNQLKKILSYPSFFHSAILRKFLTYIVNETLLGREGYIKEYTIAVEVMDKPATFCPKSDGLVRVHAARLRKFLKKYYEDPNINNDLIISIPIGRYIPVFEPLSSLNSKTKIRASINRKSTASEKVRIAVMPFRTFEVEISKLAFSDSLGQKLSSELSKSADLSVISYYETQQLIYKNNSINELASNFNVQYIVTGNVQFERKQLRIYVQLITTLNRTQVWSEVYQVKNAAASYFEITDKIVMRMIETIRDFPGVSGKQLKIKNIYKNIRISNPHLSATL